MRDRLTSKWWMRVALAMATLAILVSVGRFVDHLLRKYPVANGLHWFDWLLIVLYGVSTIALGFYFSQRRSSAKEYFVGSGKMNPLLIGVSLFATLLSSISYLSMPGEASGKGPVVACGMLALPLVYFVVAYLMLPVYMKYRVTSAYELLEKRLGLSVRLLGAFMFLAMRLVWMTLLVYLVAKAMVEMMGLSDEWIPMIVVVTGIVSVIYTSLGGLQAVVVTDAMQTALLLGGALLVLITVTLDFHGFGWFPTTWQRNWDTQPFFSFNPATRVTVIGTILSITTWYIATLGGDQTSVQRFMATSDLAAARSALRTQLVTAVIVQVTLFLVGFALLSYFQRHNDQLGELTIAHDADQLFPAYIAYQLPIGISGLVVAAMFAAAMSSIDSGVNSITAVVMTDLLGRFGWDPKTDAGKKRAAQGMALGIGLFVVLCSFSMKYLEGNITKVTGKTVNLLPGPIFALFFFALFVPRAKPLAVWLGSIAGVTTAILVAFSGTYTFLLCTTFDIDPASLNSAYTLHETAAVPLAGVATSTIKESCRDPISFQWIGPLALTVNIVVGLLFSYLLGGKPTTKSKD